MIVYVVKRCWFEKHEDADAYRRQLGLKPLALTKVSVEGRLDLAALLNALCNPPVAESGPMAARLALPLPTQVMDEAFVYPDLDNIQDFVPRFLLDEAGKKRWDELHGVGR